ncbi:hypothetical protein J6TS2_21340 [Heyndrickxia sporothermodurans]|nr:hypothetical protein J6TS2_21340 [Heyndrickxia sporothermodurans]
MIVTTAGRTNEFMIIQAYTIAKELNAIYVPRKKQSVSSIHQHYQCDCMVVGKNRIEYYPYPYEKPFFFHPNSASFRIKRLISGEKDPFIEAADLMKGSTILDCTMGLASDSIVASYVVGIEGKVIAVEANKYLHYIVKKGLHGWNSDNGDMNQAMRRIETWNSSYLDFLKKQPSKSVDVVYFDPMFEETILSSDGIAELKNIAIYSKVDEDAIKEARRIAKQRIVMKDHFRSNRFKQFNFKVKIRKSSKFHFGVIEL